jgi:hypothetical protein
LESEDNCHSTVVTTNPKLTDEVQHIMSVRYKLLLYEQHSIGTDKSAGMEEKKTGNGIK